MESTTTFLPNEVIIDKILCIRGQKVMMDRDLASLYGVQTKVLNQAVQRHLNRFPGDFMFQLDEKEFHDWKSQFVTSNRENMGLRKRPYVFSEQGVAMLSSVLNSERAVEMNIRIIRIFTRMRELLLTHKDLLLKIEQLENQVGDHNDAIQKIFLALKKLLQPPAIPPNKVGFKIGAK